jgi:hypothetical protein
MMTVTIRMLTVRMMVVRMANDGDHDDDHDGGLMV